MSTCRGQKLGAAWWGPEAVGVAEGRQGGGWGIRAAWGGRLVLVGVTTEPRYCSGLWEHFPRMLEPCVLCPVLGSPWTTPSGEETQAQRPWVPAPECSDCGGSGVTWDPTGAPAHEA